MFSSEYWINLLLSLPGILIAISFHEMAHAYAADAMGDPTPKAMGRLTINPFAHIDLLGFLCMLIMHFGWAKPVPINPSNFKDRKKGMIAVSLAGILTNLLLAFIGVAAYFIVISLNNATLQVIFQYICSYNIVFAVFNILPIPPLDGSQLLAEFLPPSAKEKYLRFARYGMFVLILLIFTGVFSYIISPVANAIMNVFSSFWSFIFGLFW